MDQFLTVKLDEELGWERDCMSGCLLHLGSFHWNSKISNQSLKVFFFVFRFLSNSSWILHLSFFFSFKWVLQPLLALCLVNENNDFRRRYQVKKSYDLLECYSVKAQRSMGSLLNQSPAIQKKISWKKCKAHAYVLLGTLLFLF